MFLKKIVNKRDVELIVRKQYAILFENSQTRNIFIHLNLETHLPKIDTFWCFVLDIDAEQNKYTGSAFEPHTKLNLISEHFNIWMAALKMALDEYEGEKKDLWWQKAEQFRIMFAYKLGIEEKNWVKKNE